MNNNTSMILRPVVSVEWLSSNLDNSKLVILDASPKVNKVGLIPKYTSIKIKGARIFDAEKVFVDTENSIPNMFPSEEKFTAECQRLGINKDSIIVVYDNLGMYMSPRVWWMFKSMGHANVTVLDGGLSAYKYVDLPCENYEQEISLPKGSFTANFTSEKIKDSNFILKNIASKKEIVIDARGNGRFTGELPEPRENMQSGHIPNAINLPYSHVLENGKMKPVEELKTIFNAFDLENSNLVFSCGSGVTACIILLASELAIENKKSLFDGSWAEWGLGTKFPVEKGN